jgi:gluconolactonase
MYITESFMGQISVMDVQKDGLLKNKRLFAKLTDRGPGVPDGIKIDEKGYIWCTGKGGIHIFNPEGKELGLFYTPHASGIYASAAVTWTRCSSAPSMSFTR